MVDAYELLKTRLLSISTISTEIGPDGVYKDEVPAGRPVKGPVLKISRIDGSRTFRGITGKPLFQVSIHDRSASVVQSLIGTIIYELAEWSGLVSGTWISIIYLSDGIFPADGWWNGTIDFQMKYIEE